MSLLYLNLLALHSNTVEKGHNTPQGFIRLQNLNKENLEGKYSHKY